MIFNIKIVPKSSPNDEGKVLQLMLATESAQKLVTAMGWCNSEKFLRELGVIPADHFLCAVWRRV